MNTLKDVFVSVLLMIVLVLLMDSELDRRAQSEELERRMKAFISIGPRFPLQYGLGLCERIHWLEIDSGRVDPVDCDAIRHSVAKQED